MESKIDMIDNYIKIHFDSYKQRLNPNQDMAKDIRFIFGIEEQDGLSTLKLYDMIHEYARTLD